MENTENGMIYRLIGEAIGKIGAIGKEKYNSQQKYSFRGIDDVYNALNPVMAELGIFICPEVLNQTREERITQNGTVLKYTILTMKYTVYAPDGSNISLTVVGEGMDAGDKSANKAMSVGMKYAMFQLFCIPTEEMHEMRDSDEETFNNVLPKGRRTQAQATPAQPAQVTRAATVPPTAPAAQPAQQAAQPAAPKAPHMNPAAAYLVQAKLQLESDMTQEFNFGKARAELIASGKVANVPSATINMEQATALIQAIYDNYGHLRKVS